MRMVFLTFIGFFLGGAYVLPQVSSVVLPKEFYTYAPFGIMIVSMLMQIEIFSFFKKQAFLLNEKKEKDLLEAELKDVKGKLSYRDEKYHASKVEIKDKQDSLKSLEKHNSTLKKEILQVKEDLAHVKTALRTTKKELEEAKLLQVEESSKEAPQSDRSVLSLLSLLQENGRFVDFIMDDVTHYSDSQVGAASRVVQMGCKKVMTDYFTIVPLRSEEEGGLVEISSKEDPSSYRLLGKAHSEAPYQGRILHRGWFAKRISLPESYALGSSSVISPAEVELS